MLLSFQSALILEELNKVQALCGWTWVKFQASYDIKVGEYNIEISQNAQLSTTNQLW